MFRTHTIQGLFGASPPPPTIQIELNRLTLFRRHGNFLLLDSSGARTQLRDLSKFSTTWAAALKLPADSARLIIGVSHITFSPKSISSTVICLRRQQNKLLRPRARVLILRGSYENKVVPQLFQFPSQHEKRLFISSLFELPLNNEFS